jgi:hypothetical protein
MALDHLSEGCSILASTVRVICRPDLLCGIPPLAGKLIWCQGNHDIYECSHGGVPMSGGDGTHTSSRVPVVSTRGSQWLRPILSGIK